MKMIFENPNNFRPQKRAPIIEEMLEKNTLEELTAAQDRLRSIYLREANEIDFEEIVMKKNFKFKNEVLFTITQLLHDLNTGEIKKKIATENRKEYKKRQKKSRSTVKYSDCGYELFKLKVPEIQNDEIFEEEGEESDFVCLYLL